MIQIDIEMPKCCNECFALDDNGDYPFCLISQDQRGYTFNTREKRMPTCPLKAQEPQGTPEAEWLLYNGMRGATCSYCKHTFDDVYDAENYDYYCRHCGAKMIRIRTVKWE